MRSKENKKTVKMDNMDIDQLILDLIEEEKFKAKYTKRQQSIFCKNMHAKISSFMENREKKLNRTLNILDKYRKAYCDKVNAYNKLSKSYEEMNKNPPLYLWLLLFYSIISFLSFCYKYHL